MTKLIIAFIIARYICDVVNFAINISISALIQRNPKFKEWLIKRKKP